MPKSGRRTTHVRSRFSRCLFTAAIAALFLMSLHGNSIAGTYRTNNTQDKANAAATKTTATARDMPLQRAALGTFAVPPESTTPILSLQGACRSEMKLYCSGATTSPLRCLVEQYYRLKSSTAEGADAATRQPSAFSDVCEAWLTARDVCLSFVHTHGKDLCGAAVKDARECLRLIPAVFLPRKCATSDYYEGVRLVGRLRQHQAADARHRRIHGQ